MWLSELLRPDWYGESRAGETERERESGGSLLLSESRWAGERHGEGGTCPLPRFGTQTLSSLQVWPSNAVISPYFPTSYTWIFTSLYVIKLIAVLFHPVLSKSTIDVFSLGLITILEQSYALAIFLCPRIWKYTIISLHSFNSHRYALSAIQVFSCTL